MERKDHEGWIDFFKQKPMVGQEIEGTYYSEGIARKGKYHSPYDTLATPGVGRAYGNSLFIFDQWRPTDKLTINSYKVDNKSEKSLQKCCTNNANSVEIDRIKGCQSKCTCIDKVIEALDYIIKEASKWNGGMREWNQFLLKLKELKDK